MLVHGYCTKSPGPFTRSHFTDAVYFEDYSANRKLDQFANMVMQFGEQFPSFSVVSHSQGGLVGIHLHSFYWSKLESATNGRMLQSVGSPYQGTALAGNLAAIGDVLGVGCGVNSEMTHDGAALWQSTLPASTTPHVHYYTTHVRIFFLSSLSLFLPSVGVVVVIVADLRVSFLPAQQYSQSGLIHYCVRPQSLSLLLVFIAFFKFSLLHLL